MRKILLPLILIAISVFAMAFVRHPGAAQVLLNGVPPMPENVYSKAQADQMAADQMAALQSAIPQPANVTPAIEATAGAIGGSPRYALADHQHPRITRAVSGVTGAAGTLDVTWPALAAVPKVLPVPTIAAGAAQPTMCEPVTGTITTTGATIKCFTTQSVTVSILGAVVAPVTTAAAGVAVQVFAIPGTP